MSNLPRRGRRGPCVQPALDHIGQQQAYGADIDGLGERIGLAHRVHSKRLSSTQQLPVDFADLLENLAYVLEVAYVLACLWLQFLWNVIYLRPLARKAHR